MTRVSKITGKLLDYEKVKEYKVFDLYEVYDKKRFLYRETLRKEEVK